MDSGWPSRRFMNLGVRRLDEIQIRRSPKIDIHLWERNFDRRLVKRELHGSDNALLHKSEIRDGAPGSHPPVDRRRG